MRNQKQMVGSGRHGACGGSVGHVCRHAGPAVTGPVVGWSSRRVVPRLVPPMGLRWLCLVFERTATSTLRCLPHKARNETWRR